MLLETIKNNIKKENGITLIALVITIIVMLILAGVAIAAINADGDIVKQSKEAATKYNNSSKDEEKQVKELLNYKDGINGWNKEKGVNSPVLANGMKAVYWETDGTEKTQGEAPDFDINKWYDYIAQANPVDTIGEGTSKWANAKTTDGSYWVWIPRYAYKITENFHQSTAGTIDVVFIDKNNKNGEKEYSTTYPTISGTGATMKMDDYVVHPAFNWGKTHLKGIWVAKYEACRNDATNTSVGTSDIIKMQPNFRAIANISVNDIFNICKNMNVKNNIYGFIETDYPHMMKNTEWGAISYLTHSKYGRNKVEIDINTNSLYLTGSGSQVGKEELASTTGNKYGIYDLRGGAYEYVAAYLETSTATTYESLKNASAEYKDVYTAYDLNKYGDAVYETSLSSYGTISWYGDYSCFLDTSMPTFSRGGDHDNSTSAGEFDFYHRTGAPTSNCGFRPTCVVIDDSV